MTVLIAAPTQTFADIFKAIGAVTDEATIAITKDGLQFVGMDPSHIMMLDLQYAAADFTHFECEQAVNLGVRVRELTKVLARFSTGETTVTVDDAHSRLVLEGLGRTFNVRLIEPHIESKRTPKVRHSIHFQIPRAEFREILKDAAVCSETNLQFHVRADGVHFIAAGDGSEYEYKFQAELGRDKEGQGQDEFSVSFSLEYLTTVIPALQGELMKVGLGAGLPMRVELPRMKFWLAPRVTG